MMLREYRRIHTIVTVGGLYEKLGTETWNDETRFRQACVKEAR